MFGANSPGTQYSILTTDMKLIVGLGNPEEKFKNTRHNVGFRMLSEYAKEKGAEFTVKEKFRARLAEFTVGGEKIILAKPTTYYNLTGEAARLITDFYKITPEDVLAADQVVDGRHRHPACLGEIPHRQPVEAAPGHELPSLLEDPLPSDRLVLLEETHL